MLTLAANSATKKIVESGVPTQTPKFESMTNKFLILSPVVTTAQPEGMSLTLIPVMKIFGRYQRQEIIKQAVVFQLVNSPVQSATLE